MSVPRRYQRTGIGSVHADAPPPTRANGRLALGGTVPLLRSLLLLTDILLTYLINRASLGFMRSSYVLKRQMEEQGLIQGDNDNLRDLRGVLLATPVVEEVDNELREALHPAYRVDTTSLVSSHQLFRSATTLFESLGPAPVPEPSSSKYSRRNLRKIDEEKRMSVVSTLSSNATLNRPPLRLSTSTPLNGSTLLRRLSEPIPRRHSVSPQPYNKSIQPPLSSRSSISNVDIITDEPNHIRSPRSPQSQPPSQQSRRASLGGVRRLGQRLPVVSPGSPNSLTSPVDDSLVASLKQNGSHASLNHRPRDDRPRDDRPRDDRSHRRSGTSRRVRNSHPSEIDLIQAGSIDTLLMMNTSTALVLALPRYTSSTLPNTSSADMLLMNLKDLRLLQFFGKKFRRSLIVSKFLNSLETTAATNASTKRKGNKYKVNLVPYNIFARGVPKSKLWS